MSELKCCPFCGGEGEAKKEIGGSCWKVKCKQCFCEVGRYWFHTKNRAIIAWNTRTPMDNIVEKLEERSAWHQKYGDSSGYTFAGYEGAIDIVKQEINNGENNT